MKRPTIDGVKLTTRSVNIPSETEIHNILSIFGYSARTSRLGELTHRLEKIRLSSIDFSNNIMRSKFELKEAVVFFISGKISIKELRESFRGKTEIERDEVLEFSLVNFDQIETSTIEPIFKSMGDDSQEFHSENYEDDCILFASLIMQADIETIEKHVSGIDLLHYLLSFLIYPGHILAANNEYQQKFFTLLYKHICYTEGASSLQDTNSELHKYIQKYFGQLDCIKNQETNGLIATVSQTKGEISRTLQVGVNKEIPKKESVFEILVAFAEDPERAAHFMHFRNHMQQGDISHKIRKYDDFGFKNQRQVALSYVSGNLDISMLDNHNFPEMGGDQTMGLFDKALIYYHSDSSKEKQLRDLIKFNEYLSKGHNNNIDPFGNELIYMIIAISLLRYDTGVAKESGILSTNLQRVYVTLLMYPRFLQKAPIEQQNRYFGQLFDVHDVEFFVNNVAVRRYLDNYFGDIPIVASRIKQIEASMATQDNLEKDEAQNIVGISKTLGREQFIPTYISIVSILNTIHGQGVLTLQDDIPDPTIAGITGMYFAGSLPPSDFDNSFTFQGSEDTRVGYNASISMLQVKSLTNNEKNTLCRKAVKIISEYKSGDINTETELLLYIILLTKFERNISKRYISKIPFAQASISLLLHRGYLDITSEAERENFFFLWFESMKGDTQLDDKTSVLWVYLEKHYGSNKVLVQNYNRIFGGTEEPKIKESPRVEDIKFDKINSDTIDISQKDGKFYLNGEIIEQNGGQICLVIWNKNKKLPVFYTIEEAKLEGFNFTRGQIAEIGFIESGKPLTKANYNQQVQSFVAIKVPVPQKERAQKQPNPDNTKPLRKIAVDSTELSNSMINEEKVQGPDQEALEIGVLIALQDGDISYEITQDGKVAFHLPQGESYVQDSGYNGICITSDIVYDISGTIPALLSFLGINKFDISEIELKSELENRLSIALKELEELKKSDAQKEIYNSIGGIAAFPKVYKEALGFFRACEAAHLLNGRENKLEAIWLGPISAPIKASIESELSQRGFGIKFDGGSITISKNDFTDKVVFNVSSGIRIEEMNTMSGTTTNVKNIAIARYLLEQVLSVIVFGYYKNNKAKSTVAQEINKKKIKREGVLKETKARIILGKADFISGWDPEGRNDVNEYIASISSKNILGKRGFLQIGNSPLTEIKREEIYNEIEAQMFESKSTYLLDYFFDRIRATHGLDSQFAEIGKDQGADIVLGMNIIDWGMKTQICQEVLNRFRSAKVSIVLMEPISFSYNELLGN